MSALIVALIVSLTLAVVPHNIANEYGNNAVGGAAGGEQSPWQVVYLNGNNAENLAKIDAAKNAPYVRFVMQADWKITDTGGFLLVYGEHVIWDLQGHALTFGSYKMSNGNTVRIPLAFRSRYVEITGGGRITQDNDAGYVLQFGEPCETVIFSGVTITQGRIMYSVNCHIVVTGETIYNGTNGKAIFGADGNAVARFTLAPYLDVTKNAAGEMIKIQPNANIAQATYAISESDAYVGAYNYAYGVAWDLAPGACILEKMTQAGPHYLWVRDSDQAWYRLLTAL